jgi:hypothetical protein
MKRPAEEQTCDIDTPIQKRAKKQALGPPPDPDVIEPPIKTYKKLKINTIDVTKDDIVIIHEWSAVESYAQVNLIYKDTITGEAMVNVTWFYRPVDVFAGKIPKYIGKAELMTSDHS